MASEGLHLCLEMLLVGVWVGSLLCLTAPETRSCRPHMISKPKSFHMRLAVCFLERELFLACQWACSCANRLAPLLCMAWLVLS